MSATAAPVAAQSNLDTRGPFYQLGPARNWLAMATAADSPAQVPTSPVTVQLWNFYGAEQTLQGPNPGPPPPGISRKRDDRSLNAGDRS